MAEIYLAELDEEKIGQLGEILEGFGLEQAVETVFFDYARARAGDWYNGEMVVARHNGKHPVMMTLCQE